jgi:hypothetical protein
VSAATGVSTATHARSPIATASRRTPSTNSSAS